MAAPAPARVAPVLVLAPAAADDYSMTGNASAGQPDPAGSKSQSDILKGGPSQPCRELLDLQTTWLAPARSRILRRIAIAHKHRILDLGAGYGQVSNELVRRSSGVVAAFDINELSLREIKRQPKIVRIAGSGTRLPFMDSSIDLVFTQFSLLWISPLLDVLAQIWRVLEPAGVLVALEPDYEAMIEYPHAISSKEIWLDALTRSGAESRIGRKLPGLLASLGFSVKVDLLEQIQQASPQRFDFLEGLPLTPAERTRLREIRFLSANSASTKWAQLSHLPIFIITAVKPESTS